MHLVTCAFPQTTVTRGEARHRMYLSGTRCVKVTLIFKTNCYSPYGFTFAGK